LHQVGTSSLLIYMMHGHTYIKFGCNYILCTPDDGYGRHPKHVE